MLQTRFIYWMRVRNMVCIQTHVWDGVKKPDSTAQTLSCGNQWLLGHWPWQATLHSTVGPGKGCGSQKLFQIRATFPNSNPKKKKAHFHGARQTIQYKAVTGRVLMLPSIQIPHPIPVNAFQIHIKEFPKHQPTFHTPAGGKLDQHLITK